MKTCICHCYNAKARLRNSVLYSNHQILLNIGFVRQSLVTFIFIVSLHAPSPQLLESTEVHAEVCHPQFRSIAFESFAPSFQMADVLSQDRTFGMEDFTFLDTSLTKYRSQYHEKNGYRHHRLRTTRFTSGSPLMVHHMLYLKLYLNATCYI